jgi:hypothetical protein
MRIDARGMHFKILNDHIRGSQDQDILVRIVKDSVIWAMAFAISELRCKESLGTHWAHI